MKLSKQHLGKNAKSLAKKYSQERVLAGKYSFSKLQLAIFVIAFALVGGYVLLRLLAAAPGTANVWIVPSGGSGTCTRQATATDFASAVSTAKCSTFQAAFDAMNGGDTAIIRSGTYSSTDVVSSGSVTTKSPAVTIEVEAGATVNPTNGLAVSGINGLTLDGTKGANGQGFNGTSGIDISVNGGPKTSNITIKGMKIHDNPHSGNTGTAVWMTNCANVVISNIEIANFWQGDGIQMAQFVSNGACNNVTFDHFNMHDFDAVCGVDHQDGIQIRAGSNITMQNSKMYNFNNCGSQGWFPNPRGDIDPNGSNINLINNLMYNINGNEINMGNFLNGKILYNTIDGSLNACQGVATPYPECINNHVTVVGNTWNTSCTNMATTLKWQADTWTKNVDGANCGYAGDTFASNWNGMFVNVAAGDYHLVTGAAAINVGEAGSAGDNCASATGAAGVDLEGNTRPQGSACDAGAYEFVVTGANVFVAPNGSDTGANCKRYATPTAFPGGTVCATFDKAYHLAACGDAVEVEGGGSYGDQNLTNDATKTACSSNVVIKPAAGAGNTQVGIKTNNLDPAGNDHGITIDGADYVTVSGFRNVHGELEIQNCTTASILDNDATADGNLYISGQTNDVIVRNSSWGGTNRYLPRVWIGNCGDRQNHNVTIGPGNVIHDVVSDDLPNFHVDGILVGEADGITFKGNTFYNNMIDDLAFGECCGMSMTDAPVIIENNFFGPSDTSIAFQSNKKHWANFNIRNNSATQETYPFDCSNGCSGNKISGNLFPLLSTASCAGAGFTYSHNVWIGSVSCGGASDISIPSAGYINSGAVPPDLHLTAGSAAIDKGDPANCPSLDIDNQARFAGAACDAGADEFNGGAPPPNAPTVSISASPNPVASGSSSTLTWSSTNATGCTASGAWTGAKATSGTQSVSPIATSTYTLACTGTGGTSSANVTLTVAAPPPPTSSTPVASYGFSEGSGTTAADSSGNNNTATLSGATWDTAGKHSKAISFNGTSTYASANDSTSLYIAGTGTMEAWVKLNVTGQWHGLIAKGDANLNAAQDYALEVTNSDTIACILGDGSNSQIVISTTGLTSGVYYHVACTWDGTNVKVFVNGTLDKTIAQTVTPAANTSPLFLGQFGGSSDFTNGSLDDVMLYNKALTPAEVTADMSVSVGGAPSDTTAPTISMTAPAGGATVSGSTTTVSANASDNVGVAGVQFQLDCPGTNCGLIGTEDTTNPYSITWDTTGITNGTHTLSAVARDAAGNTATAASVTVTVNNATPPPPDTTAPTTPASLHTTSVTTTSVRLAWNASTDTGGAGLRGYRLYKGGTFLTEVTTLNYTDSGLTPNTAYSYKVSAIDNAGNESAQSAALNVTTNSLPPTANLTASPNTITSGNSSILTWSSTNATSCTASGGWSGTKATSGTQSVSPTSTGTYSLTCTGSGGTTSPVSASITVNAPPPVPTATVTASPTTITSGNSSTLTWTSTNATACTASGSWSGSQALSGSLVVAPTTTSIYTITCTGTGGSANSSASVTVNASAPPPTPGVTGDLNGDGHVNIFDLSILLSHYGSGGTGDIDSSGAVNIIDLSILLSNYGK